VRDFVKPSESPAAVRDASNLYEKDLRRLPPWFKPSDAYGNIIGAENGTARVSLPILDGPDIAGYAYCVSEADSLGGTRCLGGATSAEISGGFVEFTDLYVYRPGSKYRLRFELNGIYRDTPYFNVLPSAPRTVGVSFDPAFTSLLIRFDSPTNQANLGSSLSCESLFSWETYESLGAGAICSWPDQRTLVVTMGNNVTLVPGSSIVFNSSLVVHTSRYWIPVALPTGGFINQVVLEEDYVSQADPKIVKLTSPRMTVPTCSHIQIPERASPESLIRSEYFVDVSVSAVEPFTIGSKRYVAVMSYCKGTNCRFDPNILFTTAKFDLMSHIYEWLPDGSFNLVQEIQCHGPLDVEQFTLTDARKDGLLEPVQFLAVANHMTLDFTPVPLSQCGDSLKCAPNVTIWAWNYDLKEPKFEVRQHIDNIAYATSVQVFSHDSRHYLAATGAGGVTSRTLIYRWVSGSYRLDEFNGQEYGWPPGQIFGWVPGLFGEFVQQVDSYNPLGCVMFHVEQDDHLYLAIANYQKNNVNKKPVTVYRWDDWGCMDQGLVSGCFEFVLDLPGSGASTLAAFSGPINGQMRDMMVVGNYFEGDQARPVAQHYEQNSHVFALNLSEPSFQHIQAIPTSGITSARVFSHCSPFFCSTLLSIANQRGFRGLSATSRLYKWSDGPGTGPNDPRDTCPYQPQGRFDIVFEMETLAAQDIMYVKNSASAARANSSLGAETKASLLYVSSAGRGTGLQVLDLENIVPAPRPVLEYSPW
jgi:hypothetical protein